MTETQIARGFRLGVEGRYAAGAAAERALIDLAAAADWNGALDGSVRSTFTDGAPAGARRLDPQTTVDLDAVRNLANCAHVWTCSEAELTAVTAERPWGLDNPRWQLFAYGPLSALLSPSSSSPFYVVALVADDPAERDGNPFHDSDEAAGSGAGIIQLRGEAFGPRGAHRAVLWTVMRVDARKGAAGVRRIAERVAD